MDPKGGELFVRELTPEETLVEGLVVTDVQFVHLLVNRGERLIEPPSSWFLPKFLLG